MGVSISRIGIEGYKSIRNAGLHLGPLTVMVGANDAGKSNVLEAVELLGRIVDGDLGTAVTLSGGAHGMLRASAKSTPMVRLCARIDGADDLRSYEARLVPAANDELVFADELLGLADGAYSLGRGHRESRLRAEIVDGVRPDAAAGVVGTLAGCRVHHFQETSRDARVRRAGRAADSVYLQPDAGNLAAFLHGLRSSDGAAYRGIVRAVRAVAPSFRDFVLSRDESGCVRLRWNQSGSAAVHPAGAMGGGTLRFACLAALLLQPRPPALVLIDEPELGLHPFAVTVLVEMMRAAAERAQLLVATQSVTLLDQLELPELVVAERSHGATHLRRPDPEELGAWLDDYSLGELWMKNVLGGRPRPERS